MNSHSSFNSTKCFAIPSLKLEHWFSARLSASVLGECAMSQTQSGNSCSGFPKQGPFSKAVFLFFSAAQRLMQEICGVVVPEAGFSSCKQPESKSERARIAEKAIKPFIIHFQSCKLYKLLLKPNSKQFCQKN